MIKKNTKVTTAITSTAINTDNTTAILISDIFSHIYGLGTVFVAIFWYSNDKWQTQKIGA